MRIALTTAAPERAMELRRTKRYYVQAPAFFSWKDSDKSSQAAEGMTRDISAQAVFVVARNCPRAGDQLRLDVQLPSLRGTPGVRLRGEGVVLRVDKAESGNSGFAVATSLHSEARDAMDILMKTHNDWGRTQ
jgi:hypothetical protein